MRANQPIELSGYLQMVRSSETALAAGLVGYFFELDYRAAVDRIQARVKAVDRGDTIFHLGTSSSRCMPSTVS